jgi:flavodoxin I
MNWRRLMKALIIYDSVYGNPEKIAQAIGSALGSETRVIRATEARLPDLQSIDLLIVGSPTQGFRSMKPVQAFIDSIPQDSLKGVKLAAFDTRMSASHVGTGVRLIMKMGGYAAPRLAKALQKKGGNLTAQPEGFWVEKQEGPLADGELERAAAWAKGIK